MWKLRLNIDGPNMCEIQHFETYVKMFFKKKSCSSFLKKKKIKIKKCG
jgi:hypothetical protein